MANFDIAVAKTLKYEGGYVNNPNDPGGATNFGITLGVLQGFGLEYDLDHDGDVDASDVKIMSVEDAKVIYENLYWNGNDIVSQAIAEKNFDMGVNMGVATAAKYLQQACTACGCLGIVADGNIGPKSINAINSINEFLLMSELCKIQEAHYWNIIIRDVEKNAISRGWSASIKESLLTYLRLRDVKKCKECLQVLKKQKLKEGKLDFLSGWIKRSSERFGI